MNYTGPSTKPHDTGVAVSIFVIKNNKLLLMKRTGASAGNETWAIPGGAVEFMEDPIDSASRELQEETGLKCTEFEVLGYTNDTHVAEKLHYITFSLLAKNYEGSPKIMEPNKCTEIGWFSLDNLPKPLFEPLVIKLADENIMKRIRTLF